MLVLKRYQAQQLGEKPSSCKVLTKSQYTNAGKTLLQVASQTVCAHVSVRHAHNNARYAGSKQTFILIYFALGKTVAYVFGTAVVQKQSIGRYISSLLCFSMLEVER